MSDNNTLFIKFENHKIPEFKEVKGKDWVYFGEDNLYPDYLIELYLRSAKHNAIINAKINYIYGGGLTIDDNTSTVTQQAVADKFALMFKNFSRQMITDLELFNAIAIEVVYNKAGNKIAELNYIPFSKIRTNVDESEYYFSNDWKASTKQDEEKTGFKIFKPFDVNSPSKGSSIYVYKILSPKKGKEKNVYPVPEYIGACASIETDIEIANYHLNNIKTGFSAGTIINFNNGVPNEEGQKTIEKQIKQKSTGTDKAGNLVVTFNKSSENAPTITSFVPNDLDKQFIEIGKRVEQDIFTGHKITSPMLFGVKTEGQLGGRTEMIDAFELFQNTYVSIRQAMLEEVVNSFAQVFGIVNRFYFKKVNVVKSLLPDSVVQRVYDDMEIDELREHLGLPKKKKIQQFSLEKPLYEVLFEREWNGESDEDCINEFKKMSFKSELTANERAIVDLLSKDELMPSEDISKVLKISVSEVNSLIDSLNERGYLTDTTPTEDGERVVDEDGAKTLNIEIKYKYDWRVGVTPDKKNSRDFCRVMLERTESQDGWMSREEIDNLDNEQDLPVWDSRGGWWNKKGVNVPFCRHIWKQMVVKRK